VRPVKVGSNIEPERVVPLLVTDLAEVTMGHLERRVANQYIDSAEFSSSTVDYRSAVRRLGQVTAYHNTFATGVLNETGHLHGVLVLVEIGDQHVGALAGISDGHGTTDTAVTSRDHRTLTRQPTRAAVSRVARLPICGERAPCRCMRNGYPMPAYYTGTTTSYFDLKKSAR
jgi:hypothetical protein